MIEAPDLLAGRYRLLEQCGAGGMSVVWHAYDDVLQRDVAVKLLRPEFAGDGELHTAIRREARAAAKLSHPGIASVFDFGETRDGAAFVVMELVAGTAFSVRLRDGPVPWPEAVSVCGQVAAAMAQAHAQGVVHRDIKPGNVMVTATGVKVVDFGVSAVAGEADPGGQLLGTPDYMAPERLTGRRADSAADVYSLGLMLYRALAGELPWSTDSARGALAVHAAGPAHLLRRPPGTPPELLAACQACVAKDPDRRPTMAELAEIMAAVAPGPVVRPIPVPPPRAEPTLPMTEPVAADDRPARRGRHLVYAGVAAALLLAAMTVGMLRLADGPRPDPGASFGDAAVSNAPSNPPVAPVQAGNGNGDNGDNDSDNSGPGTSGNNGNGNGSGNGGSGSGRSG